MNTSDSNSIFRIDFFDCPIEFISELEERLCFIHEFLGTQPGCLYNKVVASRGEAQFRIVTVIEWQDEASIAEAKSAAAKLYEEIGFNPQAFMAERGIEGDFGTYRSFAALSEPS